MASSGRPERDGKGEDGQEARSEQQVRGQDGAVEPSPCEQTAACVGRES